MSKKKCKILAISGGGTGGIIPATFLSFVDRDRPLKGIDVITGASVGGMLSLAYAAGRGFREVATIFKKKVKKIFKKRAIAKIWPLACPTYDNKELDKTIDELVKTMQVKDIKTIYPNLSIFVGSTNVTDDIFKVYDNITGEDDEVFLKDIAGQTSAAPSYFPGRNFNGKCMVDQGLIDNFGMMTAATGVKSKLGIPFEDMDILILGCGQDKDISDVATPERYNNYNLLEICTKLIVPYVTYSNQLVSEFWGKNMGFNKFFLYNPIITNGQLDDTSKMSDYIKECVYLKPQFIDLWDEWLNG